MRKVASLVAAASSETRSCVQEARVASLVSVVRVTEPDIVPRKRGIEVQAEAAGFGVFNRARREGESINIALLQNCGFTLGARPGL